MRKLWFGFAVFTVLVLAGCSSIAKTPSPTPGMVEMVRSTRLHQSGVGMFFGTGPDLSSGTPSPSTASWKIVNHQVGENVLNVTGLDTQFPDNTTLWVKFTCPGPEAFGSPTLIFRIQKMNSINQEFVKDVSVPVDAAASIVRFEMPSFSTGPGKYSIAAMSGDKIRFRSRVKYLAPGEQSDSNFVSY